MAWPPGPEPSLEWPVAGFRREPQASARSWGPLRPRFPGVSDQHGESEKDLSTSTSGARRRQWWRIGKGLGVLVAGSCEPWVAWVANEPLTGPPQPTRAIPTVRAIRSRRSTIWRSSVGRAVAGDPLREARASASSSTSFGSGRRPGSKEWHRPAHTRSPVASRA